jgi:hypothetical protein
MVMWKCLLSQNNIQDLKLNTLTECSEVFAGDRPCQYGTNVLFRNYLSPSDDNN